MHFKNKCRKKKVLKDLKIELWALLLNKQVMYKITTMEWSLPHVILLVVLNYVMPCGISKFHQLVKYSIHSEDAFALLQELWLRDVHKESSNALGT